MFCSDDLLYIFPCSRVVDLEVPLDEQPNRFVVWGVEASILSLPSLRDLVEFVTAITVCCIDFVLVITVAVGDR